jgi:hypothetical protein
MENSSANEHDKDPKNVAKKAAHEAKVDEAAAATAIQEDGSANGGDAKPADAKPADAKPADAKPAKPEETAAV